MPDDHATATGALTGSFTFTPIATVHSGLIDKFGAPRQPFVAGSDAGLPSAGTIELVAGRHFEDALADLALFSHIWVLFVFHRNATWHPKVMPPMGSDIKRGVFATRSPHRPNPIGMSVLRLLRVDGLVLHVEGLDMLDGTPVLDIKPYVPIADQPAGATSGWLDPAVAHASVPGAVHYAVVLDPLVAQKTAWWREATGEDLAGRIAQALRVAPKPQAYRRIRKGPNGAMILGLPGWRVPFEVEGQVVTVRDVRSAHKPSHLAADPSLHHHRDFIAAFGA